jgi:hypothetical protein
MWDDINGCFYTGTTPDGMQPNLDNYPLDPQTWYIQALQDTSSLYTHSMAWAKNYCYIENFTSPEYAAPLWGFDFNYDRDGIWYEGTAQAALSYKMISQCDFADSLLLACEYAQTHGPQNDRRGIVAADHDNLSTGFTWQYHNRLHVAPTAWYIFAKLGVNPYYLQKINQCQTVGIQNESGIKSANLKAYPNPFKDEVAFDFLIERISDVELIIYNIQGDEIVSLCNEKYIPGKYTVEWDCMDSTGIHVPPGIYIATLKIDNVRTSIKLNRH